MGHSDYLRIASLLYPTWSPSSLSAWFVQGLLLLVHSFTDEVSRMLVEVSGLENSEEATLWSFTHYVSTPLFSVWGYQRGQCIWNLQTVEGLRRKILPYLPLLFHSFALVLCLSLPPSLSVSLPPSLSVSLSPTVYPSLSLTSLQIFILSTFLYFSPISFFLSLSRSLSLSPYLFLSEGLGIHR